VPVDLTKSRIPARGAHLGYFDDAFDSPWSSFSAFISARFHHCICMPPCRCFKVRIIDMATDKSCPVADCHTGFSRLVCFPSFFSHLLLISTRDGNDGPWYSFSLQVGTPSQNVKVLISTAGTQTWVVAPDGCTPLDPSNCAISRGGEYLCNQSSTHVPNLTNVSSNIHNLSFESSLGYTGLGRYGFDDITLGWQGSGGPMLKNQTIAGIAAKVCIPLTFRCPDL
jgi:hypothetical protein